MQRRLYQYTDSTDWSSNLGKARVLVLSGICTPYLGATSGHVLKLTLRLLQVKNVQFSHCANVFLA
jgi:hypothetical protein